MAITGAALGSSIVTATNALSSTDKADPTACWQAIGNAIMTGLATNPYIEVLGGVGFQNSWANFGAPYNTAGYFKDSSGVVHLKGLVNGSGTTVIFTLPAGYRPPAQSLFAVIAQGASAARIDILANGNVLVQAGPAGTGWITLENIHFLATQ